MTTTAKYSIYLPIDLKGMTPKELIQLQMDVEHELDLRHGNELTMPYHLQNGQLMRTLRDHFGTDNIYPRQVAKLTAEQFKELPNMGTNYLHKLEGVMKELGYKPLKSIHDKE